jgi:hypothetical protein
VGLIRSKCSFIFCLLNLLENKLFLSFEMKVNSFIIKVIIQVEVFINKGVWSEQHAQTPKNYS